MTVLAIANWRGPVPNRTPNGMHSTIRGLAFHIEEGTENGTNSWFHDPNAQASSHFGNPKVGRLDQFVDTSDKAWAECAGNPSWWSVEHEGYSGDYLTESQLNNDADLMVELHRNHGVPLQTCDDINGMGLIWHGAGGNAWGGHFDCPGKPIISQRPEILKRALNKLHLPAGPAHSAPASHAATPEHPHGIPAFPGDMHLHSHGAGVREAQQQLKDRGWQITVDGDYGPGTARIVAAFQADKHLKVDGDIGPVTWHALFVTPVTH